MFMDLCKLSAIGGCAYSTEFSYRFRCLYLLAPCVLAMLLYFDDICFGNLSVCSDKILTFGINEHTSPAKVGTGCLEFKLLAGS